MKLKTKLYLLIVVLVIIISGMFIMIFQFKIEASNFDRELEKTFVDIKEIRQKLIHSLSDGNHNSIDIVYFKKLIIKYNSKNLFYSVEETSNQSQDKLLNNQYTLDKVNGYYRFNSNFILKISDVYYKIYCNRDFTNFINNAKQDRWILIFSVTIFGGFVILVSYGFIFLLTRDISKLVRFSYDIALGANNDIRVRKSSELYQLYYSMIEMQSEIKISEEKLNYQVKQNKKMYNYIVHEFKTPLTSIIGYSDLLIDNKLKDEDFHESLSFINLESRRLSNIVNEMYELMRGKVEFEYVNLKNIINHCIKLNLSAIELKNIDINYDQIDFKVKGSEILLISVFNNLISNSINSLLFKGKITIKTEANSILVIDNGEGFDTSKINYFNDDRTESSTGMGFGMKIVKDILYIHDAEINFDSNNKKTIVSIKFTS